MALVHTTVVVALAHLVSNASAFYAGKVGRWKRQLIIIIFMLANLFCYDYSYKQSKFSVKSVDPFFAPFCRWLYASSQREEPMPNDNSEKETNPTPIQLIKRLA